MLLINFLSNIDVIFLGVWFVVTSILLFKFLYPARWSNFSYINILFIVVVLHLVYGALVTWGQYYVWSIGGDITKALLNAPLPVEAPLPSFLEWGRKYFEQPLGYFSYYILGRIWLSIIILFSVTLAFSIFLKVYSVFSGNNIKNEEIAIITATLLLSGWPNVLILIPLAFVFAIMFAFIDFSRFGFKNQQINLPFAFTVAALFSIVFGSLILNYFGAYTLLVL